MTGNRVYRGVAVLAAAVLLPSCAIGRPAAGPRPSATSASPSASPSPSVPTRPVAGECHNIDFAEQIQLTDDPAVPCDGVHIAETFFVGEFTGVAAALEKPPLLKKGTGAAARAQSGAYAICAKEAEKYLGHSWIHPSVSIRIIVPDDASWAAGQRWYRCDLYELRWGPGYEEQRLRSFKERWPGPSCYETNTDKIEELSCEVRHPSEFVGGFMLPTSLKKEPVTDRELAPFYDKCYAIAASYLGMSKSRTEALVGVWVWWQFDSNMWPSGRRAGWCYTWTGKSRSTYVTGSAKGRQGKGL